MKTHQYISLITLLCISLLVLQNDQNIRRHDDTISKQTNIRIPVTPSDSVPATFDSNTIDPGLRKRLAIISKRRGDRYFDPKAVNAALARESAWQMADSIPTSLPLKQEELEDGRQFIHFDTLKAETLIPGDTITLTVDEFGPEYIAQIDSVIVHDNRHISWHGHLQGLDDTYNLSFTRSDTLTFGGLSTPQGHYVLQAHGSKGWIASSRLLHKFDPKQIGILEP